MSFPFTEIENKIGYAFKNKELLEEAFTHKTYSNSFGGKHNDIATLSECAAPCKNSCHWVC